MGCPHPILGQDSEQTDSPALCFSGSSAALFEGGKKAHILPSPTLVFVFVFPETWQGKWHKAGRTALSSKLLWEDPPHLLTSSP